MTLITIINKNIDSLIPIIHEFHTIVKKHILIYDESLDEKKLAQKLKSGIEKIQKESVKVELIEVDEDSKNDLSLLQTQLPKKNLFLNATESDLALVVLLSGFVLQNDGSVLAYDRFDNSYNKIDKKGFTNHTIKNNLTLNEYFAYNGYKKLSSNTTNELQKREAQLNFIFKTPQKLFLTMHTLRTQKHKFLDSSFKNALIGLKVIDKKLSFTNEFKGFGTLLEEFIYLKLTKYNFDDIMLGVEVMFDKDLEVYNEFDILAIKNNHIIIVECKWGEPSSANEIIYKLDSVLENFGDDAKGFIVNIQQNFNHFSEKNEFVKKLFSKRAYSRATYNNLEIYNDYLFNEAVFEELLQEFLLIERLYNKRVKNQAVFLLGGYDLEMVEIKKLLQIYEKPFIDKKLSWGAKLSFYQEIFNKKTHYYGIELIEDIQPPQNYIAIDHHNNTQKKKSSLEQIADILHVELSRYQKLVALNDSGYISAMKAFGATEVEIELIRQKDREAQGVTHEDEILAEISIENGKKANNIFVVEAQTPHFSAIVDRLYEKEENILIYTITKLIYYGKGIEFLVKKYKKDILKQKAYYGGNFGFFGLAEKKYLPEEIEKIKKEILSLL